MKKVIFLIIIITGCVSTQKINPVKPLIIQNNPQYIIGEKMWQYEFKDANGIYFISYEKHGYYHKGDTIK